jgi:hypothetical protein
MPKYIVSGCEERIWNNKGKVNYYSREISAKRIEQKFAPEAISQIENEGSFKWEECHGGVTLHLEVRKVNQ